MSRFYVKPEDVRGCEILVSQEEAHHIIDVMRMRAGDIIVAFDGTGKEYIGKILNTSNESLKIKIEKINSIKEKNKISITLAQSLSKGSKMDFIVEKATELGVDEIVPLSTERTIVRLAKEKQPVRVQYWQRIAVGASKQCGRVNVPKVRSLALFDEILKEIKDYDLAMMACLTEDTKPLNQIISVFKGKTILIMVGPEGDFTPKEIEAARSAGAKLVSLGRLVLRVDTAALYLLSVLNYESSV